MPLLENHSGYGLGGASADKRPAAPRSSRRVGPASSSPEVLRELFEAGGWTSFRLNLRPTGPPRGRPRNVRRNPARVSEGWSAARFGIMGDLPGPKPATWRARGRTSRSCTRDRNVVLRGDTHGTPGNAELLTVQWDGFAKAVSAGDPVFLADGRVRLKVVSVEGGDVTCEDRGRRAPSAPIRA